MSTLEDVFVALTEGRCAMASGGGELRGALFELTVARIKEVLRVSEIFFSYELSPDALQPAIKLLSLTALTDALRAVSSEPAALSACTNELAILIFWTVLRFALALRVFRWQ